MLPGNGPAENGIVGNGWYDREDCEVKFWKQSNKLVQARRSGKQQKSRIPSLPVPKCSGGTICTLTADYSVTPRPQYHADGVKAPTVIRIRPIYGMSCNRNWVSSHCLTFGDRTPISNQQNGSLMHPCEWITIMIPP